MRIAVFFLSLFFLLPGAANSVYAGTFQKSTGHDWHRAKQIPALHLYAKSANKTTVGSTGSSGDEASFVYDDADDEDAGNQAVRKFRPQFVFLAFATNPSIGYSRQNRYPAQVYTNPPTSCIYILHRSLRI